MVSPVQSRQSNSYKENLPRLWIPIDLSIHLFAIAILGCVLINLAIYCFKRLKGVIELSRPRIRQVFTNAVSAKKTMNRSSSPTPHSQMKPIARRLSFGEKESTAAYKSPLKKSREEMLMPKVPSELNLDESKSI